ncbi:MAG TPA: hypothetical protein VGG37_03205 [Opitutaceae bacterium]|jgi:hypothetical protein
MPIKSLSTPVTELVSRWCLHALLVLSALGWTGCTTTSAMRYSPTAVAALSPDAEVVQPFEALRLGKAYVAAHPGTDYLVGSGDSMRPLYPDHTVVVLEPVPFANLKPGMTAVYSTDLGRTIAHVLVKKTSDGWVAMGVSNAACDPTLVTAENLQGVVVKAFTPNKSPMVALLDEANRATVVASMR